MWSPASKILASGRFGKHGAVATEKASADTNGAAISCAGSKTSMKRKAEAKARFVGMLEIPRMNTRKSVGGSIVVGAREQGVFVDEEALLP